MTVKELIEFLQTQPQDLVVAYCCFSEQCTMDTGDIQQFTGGVPRRDGWIHDPRPDAPTQDYLLFPGN